MSHLKENAAQHLYMVESSWERCREAGLEHNSKPIIEINDRGSYADSIDKNRVLLETTKQKVMPFYEHLLENSGCLVQLADYDGQILNSWGEQHFSNQPLDGLFNKGAFWKEGLVGTNAIGTALATSSIVQIHYDEHFLLANRFMTGSAAPIIDAQGDTLGVIDISTDKYIPQAHTLGLVKMMSQAVENQIIISNFQASHLLFWFNTSAENIDSQWSALLVLDDTGRVISSNKRAKLVMGEHLVDLNVEQLFNQSLPALLSNNQRTANKVINSQGVRFYGQIVVPKKLSLIKPTGLSDTKMKKTGPLTVEKINSGDPSIARSLRQVSKVIGKNIPILIYGETGAGKEVFVKAIHQLSERAKGNLVAVNCAAIPKELVESELFGYEKGAFTGANPKGYIGLIREANEGTLFLDELGDMPLNIQTRLLRVLQEKKVTPVGSTKSYEVDFQLFSATNVNLKQRVSLGEFRQDLFYRISGLNITLPALRDRQDKEQIIKHLVNTHKESDERIVVTSDVIELFKNHPWPGNVRQMEAVIQIALAMSEEGEITAEHLPDDFFEDMIHDEESRTLVTANDADEVEWYDIYQKFKGNISETAKALGVSRNTIYKRLREKGIK
jgi:transcriptional regulator of acetoin/glycerol metabolism